jgi:hypothetical protein
MMSNNKDKTPSEFRDAGYSRETRHDTVVYTKTLPPVQPLPSSTRAPKTGR